MKASDVLRGAAELLVTKGWCRGAAARDALGNHVMVDSPEARRFCALGAICRAEGPRDSSADMTLSIVLGGYITDWNDRLDRKQGDVVAAMDAAYVLALQEEGLEPEDVL